MLGFQTYRCTLLIHDSLFAFYSTVEEVSGVNLDARFVCIDFECDACYRADELGCNLVDVAFGLQYPVVVKALAELDLLVVEVGYILADSLRCVEVERCAGYGHHFSASHESVVYWSDAVSCQVEEVVHG